MSVSKKISFSLVFVVFTIIAIEVVLAVIAQTQKINRQQSVQPNRPQIVTLGDSVTQGGYPRPLQSMLSERWLVQDLAASGRGMDYAVDTLKSKSADWGDQRTMVLMMIGHNDCMYLQSFAQQHHIDKADSWVTRSKRTLRKLRTFRVLVQIVTRIRPSSEPLLIREPPPRLGSTQELRYCKQTIDTGIAEINAFTESNGHALTLLTYPIPLELSPKDKRPDHLLQVNRLVNQLLIESAQKYAIHLIDTAQCMAKQPRLLWESDAVHLTNEGDEAFANCLLPLLSLDRI